MSSRHLRADFVYAWPGAEIAVMGPEGAANIIFRKEIMSADNPDEMRKKKVQEYKDKFANPYVAASRGYVDAVIEPGETRKILMHSLEILMRVCIKLISAGNLKTERNINLKIPK